MTSILGLDCSKFIGWAYMRSADDKARCRTWQAKDTWLVEEYGSYFCETETWLIEMVRTFQPEVIAFESPLLLPRRDGRGTDEQQVRRLVGVVSIVEKVAYQLKVRCFEVNVQSAKAHMGVAGRRPEDMTQQQYKDQMLNAVTALGHECGDNHQADAVAVALTVYDQLGETP